MRSVVQKAPQRQDAFWASCKERNKLASFVSMVLIQNTNNRVNKRSVGGGDTTGRNSGK